MSRFGLGLEQRQTTRLEQKLVITPQLQQAIKLLQLNQMELMEALEEELLENPLLEEDVEEDFSKVADTLYDKEEANLLAQKERETEDFASEQKDKLEDFDWGSYFDDEEAARRSLPSFRESNEDEIRPGEFKPSPYVLLKDHLQDQIRLTRLSQDVLHMCVLMSELLNQDGWLVFEESPDEDPLDVVTLEMLKIVHPEDYSRYIPREFEDPSSVWRRWREAADRALYELQELDPPGIGARNLCECLTLQNDRREDDRLYDLVDLLLKSFLEPLQKKQYQAVGKKIKVAVQELLEAEAIIAEFDPFPGRLYSDDFAMAVTPDIFVEKVAGKYVITQNDDGLPKLKISQKYKDMIRTGKEEDKQYVQEQLRNATFLIRSIHQRQKTIYKVMDSIMTRQADFFERGIEFLKPMVLRDVAEDIEMHESTISRVTSSKYVETPSGLYELKFFFSSSIQTAGFGEDVSSKSVKEKIKRFIDEEDAKKPVSDQKIVDFLEKEGIQIARRTVTKYRKAMGIPSTTQRKNRF